MLRRQLLFLFLCRHSAMAVSGEKCEVAYSCHQSLTAMAATALIVVVVVVAAVAELGDFWESYQ